MDWHKVVLHVMPVCVCIHTEALKSKFQVLLMEAAVLLQFVQQ